MADTQQLEQVVRELIELYGVTAPPIPIEQMLQHPHPDMWNDVDMDDFSSSFLNIKTPFSPRISLARFLARQIAKSDWGAQRGVEALDGDEDAIYRFARMIAMPVDLVLELNAESRTAQLVSLHFEVPEEDARLRLQDLATYAH